MLRRFLLVGLLAGCQAVRTVPDPPGSDRDSIPPAPLPGSVGLTGKIVVLDPGHGGKETGAVGFDGTEEKAINLAVALDLAARRRGAGATVYLTRDTDREIAGADAPLGQELLGRSGLANQVGADLLLSIHHNATLNEKVTERAGSETYYRMDDLGASLEAANSIHRWLVRGLNPPTEAMIPGNYAVLRSAQTAAVLGEASYLTNPPTERRLLTPAGISQEAEAYYYGICEYFAPGVPKVLSLNVNYAAGPLRPEVTARVTGGGSALDPQALELTVSGSEERPVLRGDTLAWQPAQPLPNGDHPVKLQVRNLAGRTSIAATTSIHVAAPPAAMTVSPALPFAPTGGPLPILISVIDALGRPVADGTKIKLKASAGELAQDEITTRGGQASAYVIRIPATGMTLTAKSGTIAATAKLSGTAKGALMGLVTGRGGQPLEGAQILISSNTKAMSARTNREGLWWLPRLPAGMREIRILVPGYREEYLEAHSASFRWSELEPLAGFWVDQTVVIDPEGGDARQRSPAARTQHANWRVAVHLKETFEAAGAKVLLTRRPDESPPDIVRVRVANEADASLYLRIGHLAAGGTRSRAEHYPSSKLGQKLAEGISRNLAEALGTQNDGSVPSTIYPLIQTTSPAVAVYPGGIEEVPDQSLESRCRLEAFAIFRGLMPALPDAAQIKVRALTGVTPIADALIRLDGAWVGQTGPDGTWTFPGMQPGEHHLTVDDGRRIRQLRVVGLEAGENRNVTVDMGRPDIPDDLG